MLAVFLKTVFILVDPMSWYPSNCVNVEVNGGSITNIHVLNQFNGNQFSALYFVLKECTFKKAFGDNSTLLYWCMMINPLTKIKDIK